MQMPGLPVFILIASLNYMCEDFSFLLLYKVSTFSCLWDNIITSRICVDISNIAYH